MAQCHTRVEQVQPVNSSGDTVFVLLFTLQIKRGENGACESLLRSPFNDSQASTEVSRVDV